MTVALAPPWSGTAGLMRSLALGGAQAEGEALARRNGELDAGLRRARANARQAEGDRDRLSQRVAALDRQVRLQPPSACRPTACAVRATPPADRNAVWNPANPLVFRPGPGPPLMYSVSQFCSSCGLTSPCGLFSFHGANVMNKRIHTGSAGTAVNC